jgi:glutamate formiminotransferase
MKAEAFTLHKSIEILERTPLVLLNILNNISVDWTNYNEGGETWSAFEIIGHLIHGEKTDWMERVELILSAEVNKTFTPFDRFEHLKNNKGKSIEALLTDFQEVRTHNLKKLKALAINEKDLEKTGQHPTFGAVTLAELIATWVVHDLNHIAQIARVMAKQYKEEVGPWVSFLKILNQN